MEFITSTIIPAKAEDLRRRLTIGELSRWCASIENVISDSYSSGEIYCVWGTFIVTREELSHGVRFSLPNCPNALQWTVTTGHQPNLLHTVVHCSINRTEQDQDFVDSISKFVDDWKKGLETYW